MLILNKIWKRLLKILSRFDLIGIILYTKRIHSSEKKIDYQSRFLKFNISPGEKVLDIGSGGEPFPYATHLVDKYPKETHHRYNKLKTNNLPFTQADIENLPFGDKEFDFVYCAHVLEHINIPAKACDEIMRVGKRGYIEVPTRMSDIMCNFTKLPDFHRWYINVVGNSLIFVEYSDYEKRNTGDLEFFNMAHSRFNNPIRKMYRKNKDLFSNMFLWNKSFNYFIFNKDGKLIGYKKNRYSP